MVAHEFETRGNYKLYGKHDNEKDTVTASFKQKNERHIYDIGPQSVSRSVRRDTHLSSDHHQIRDYHIKYDIQDLLVGQPFIGKARSDASEHVRHFSWQFIMKSDQRRPTTNNKISDLPTSKSGLARIDHALQNAQTKGGKVGVYCGNNESYREFHTVEFDLTLQIQRDRDVIGMLSGYYALNSSFSSQYQLCCMLGDGANGFVISCVRRRDGVKMATKFIHKIEKLMQNWISLDDPRFYNGVKSVPSEVMMLKTLDHPNIIKYFDVYDDDKYLYLVMEEFGAAWNIKALAQEPLYESECETNGGLYKVKINKQHPSLETQRKMCDLFECIDAHGFLPERVIYKIFSQIYRAICYLASRGISHRDIKDENILVDGFYNIRIIDFGSASFIPINGMFNNFSGTKQFAAPETLLMREYSASSYDVWTLGVLLYTMIFSCSPFNGPEQAAECARPTMPSSSKYEHRKKCFKKFDHIWDLICRMLDVNPDARIGLNDIIDHEWMTENYDCGA